MPRLRRTSQLRSRRSVQWGRGPEELNGAFAATGAALWSTAIALTVSKSTIVRIRGYLQAIQLSNTAAGDGFGGAVGIGVTTAAAFAAGVAACPTPLTEEEWDGWMWHHYFQLRAVTATIADGVNSQAVAFEVDIDTKAMRKLTDEMVVFGCTEVELGGTATMELQARSRMLLKLS